MSSSSDELARSASFCECSGATCTHGLPCDIGGAERPQTMEKPRACRHLRIHSCGCRGNRRSREVRKHVINGCGSGALMMRAMWTRLPSKVVSALWAGSRNSYSLPTHERELREMTLRQSQRCGESLMVISPSRSSPAKPVLIMARKSMSSWSHDSRRALAIVHK